jgi:hypothetical protein
MSSDRVYTVFGGALRSAVPFDDLPESPSGAADWTLRATGAFAGSGGELLGEDIVYGTTLVRGYRTGSGFALEFDDTGRFEVSKDGSSIVWHRPEAAVLDAARADITSRVLALALHARGVFSLHASAVSLPSGEGITFMAPKHHGKSTLCSALVLAGARALSDDTVPVRPGNPPLISPGLPRLRLWSDAASRLFGVGSKDEAITKRLMDQLDDSQIETRSIPFRAAYVLSPAADLPDGAAAARLRLAPVSATIALVAHSKLGPVLSGSESPTMLALASEIARVVPVYTLHVVRDLDRVEEAARTIMEWHAPSHRDHA